MTRPYPQSDDLLNAALADLWTIDGVSQAEKQIRIEGAKVAAAIATAQAAIGIEGYLRSIDATLQQIHGTICDRSV